MFIGIGAGSPLVALFMLLVTGFGSYFLFRMLRRRWDAFDADDRGGSREEAKVRRRQYYYDQREQARRMSELYDLTDEEIERKVDDEFRT